MQYLTYLFLLRLCCTPVVLLTMYWFKLVAAVCSTIVQAKYPLKDNKVYLLLNCLNIRKPIEKLKAIICALRMNVLHFPWYGLHFSLQMTSSQYLYYVYCSSCLLIVTRVINMFYDYILCLESVSKWCLKLPVENKRLVSFYQWAVYVSVCA